MMCRHQSPAVADCIVALAAVACLLHAAATAAAAVALTPPDHLVPPPLPTPQRLTHAKAPRYPVFEARPIPLQSAAPPTNSLSVISNSNNNSNNNSNGEQPSTGLMTRIARWFGYGPDEAPRDQQLAAASAPAGPYKSQSGKPTYHSYAYPKPGQQQLQEGGKKAPCNLCNHYPWVPMLPPSIQYPLSQQYQQHQQQHHQQQQQQHQQQQQQHPQQQQQISWAQAQPILQAQGTQHNAHQHSVAQPQLPQQQLPVRQRAVQFHFPKGTASQYALNALAPIPVPNLSGSALPPLYSAQPFRPVAPAQWSGSGPASKGVQQLPTIEPAHFTENIGAHSELQPDRVLIPTQIPPTTSGSKDASFEIIKSHQLTEFVASVEYPATFVQSASIDVSQPEAMPANHKPSTEAVSTVTYHQTFLDPSLNKHIPASQILTDVGSFGSAQNTPQQQASSSPGFTAQPLRINQEHNYQQQHNQGHQQQHHQPQHHHQQQNQQLHQQQNEQHYESLAADNYPSASSHNLTEIEHNNNFDGWTVPSNSFYYSSTAHPHYTDPLELSTATPLHLEADFATEVLHESTAPVDFVPALQTNLVYHQPQPKPPSNEAVNRQQFAQRPRGRETPKRLLNAPIQYVQGAEGSPRPFTRDPSELGLRLAAGRYTQSHPYAGVQQPTPVPPLSVSSADPTPTSSYGAIDASGQFAGMSPPAPPPPALASDIHQIVIPYTTKNRPRPFQSTRGVETSSAGPAFAQWSHSNGAEELHEQQESKLVTSATEAPPNTRRTTKYLTKILASNLRELLQREHEVKSKNVSGFDIKKLQKNIDDWTEQEYTSLSHRPSTPTIRGRSKHIPAEYLPTTTMAPRKAKTTRGFDTSDLSTSINNLEPSLVERGTKRFEYTPIVDNHLREFYETLSVGKQAFSASTSSTERTTTTTSTTTESTPYYVRAVPTLPPVELWQNAKVSISRQTQEKVYVVTPQPRFFPQRGFATSTESPASKGGIGKSPRFLVRPTPRNGTLSNASSSREFSAVPFYSPELFGLMGLSAFVPAEPVEIIDGNSKVVTIVTPSISAKQTTDEHRSEDSAVQRIPAKPTMAAPSPR